MVSLDMTDINFMKIDDDYSRVGELFLKNPDPIYIIDSEQRLHGIITLGDFLRKSSSSCNLVDLINKNFIRIDERLRLHSGSIDATPIARKLFELMPPQLNEIPVTSNGAIQCVYKRDSKPATSVISMKPITNALKLFSEGNIKKIVLYGNNEIAELISLSVNNINVEYFVDDDILNDVTLCDKPVRNVFDIGLENPADIFVLVIKPDSGTPHIHRVMMSCNLMAGTDYAVLFCAANSKGFSLLRDSHLGFGAIIDIPGFAVYGKPSEADLKVVALGGSATDHVRFGRSGHQSFSSWPECLYYLLESIGIDAVVYNGGFSNYASSAELVKLIRDVMPMNPDVVISYGGINDFLHKNSKGLHTKTPFLGYQQELLFDWIAKYENRPVLHGLENNKDADIVWIDNMRMMNSICNEFKVKFLGVLQPTPYSEECVADYIDGITKSLSYNMLYNSCIKLKTVYDDLEAQILDIPFIRSFRRIFSTINDVFFDYCHVQERVNQIIAIHMLEALMELDYLAVGEKV